VTSRYLDLLRDALLDRHYLENELRIAHLLEATRTGVAPDPDKLVNPVRSMAQPLRQLKEDRDTGELPGDPPGGLAYASLGRVRLEHLRGCLDALRAEGIAGDLVDAGTGRGGAAIFMRGFLAAHDLAGPSVVVADRFQGAADLTAVREAFDRFDLLDERVVFLQGPPAETLAEERVGDLALLRVDATDAEEVLAVLAAAYDKLVPGGFAVVDGYGVASCAAAVDAFRAERGVTEPLERVDGRAAAWRVPARKGRRRARPSSFVAPTTKDLGVVVVVHNMRREAARTLHSLSRSYQRGVDGLDYEVIVVDNGSSPEQRLDEAFVRSFGPEFRLVDLDGDAAPSPAPAVNRGIEASAARNVGVMIDGAHVLTPGVLRHAMLGLTGYAPAVINIKQWYVGPGQQPLTVAGGYDQDVEDRLFEQIRWPKDGYRLFEIGHFIGDRDWFDGEWESNCLFVPRAILDQVGAMDERFATPGGGFANLDFFERVVSAPGVTLVTVLGEGSFHQVHGGTTTNNTEPTELIRSYERQYEELRGRRFRIPAPPPAYVGKIPPAARRIKPRRVNAFRHFRDAHVDGSGDRPPKPLPVPQDLAIDFIDAFWRSDEWHRALWLGRATHRAPTDLFVYQELLHRVRPDWIVETRTGVGGRALFLATICDLLDHGQVLSIDHARLGEPPEHPRITYLHGDPGAPATGARAKEIVGEDPRALAILGGAAAPAVMAAFRNYAPLVPVGSYVIVEDTILEGNPVWPDFGPGPRTAVPGILDMREFVAEPSLERFALTFNRGGYLRRVR
jgi:cephalosporin hydroxylase